MGMTILLADSVPGVRKIERVLLEKSRIAKSWARLKTNQPRFNLITALQPQVVLTDFNVRNTGNVLAMQVKSQSPRTRVLGVTELKSRYVRKFLENIGADELLDKRELETKLVTTLRLIARS